MTPLQTLTRAREQSINDHNAWLRSSAWNKPEDVKRWTSEHEKEVSDFDFWIKLMEEKEKENAND